MDVATLTSFSDDDNAPSYEDPIDEHYALHSLAATRVHGPVVGQHTGTIHYHMNDPSTPSLKTVSSKRRAREWTTAYINALDFAQRNMRRQDIAWRHAENTCQWVLQNPKYVNWCRGNISILWIRGHPGSGKSTLMEYLLSVREKQVESGQEKLLVLSFFLNARGGVLEHSFQGLLRSVLLQILNRAPRIWSDFFRSQSPSRSENPPFEDNLTENALRSALRCALSLLPTENGITLFVDALDEAGKEIAVEIISYFQTLIEHFNRPNRSRGWLKICFSSRWYPNVTLDSRLVVAVEECNGQDIVQFVQQQLAANHFPMDTMPQVKDVVISRANGIFLWVFLVVREIHNLCLEGASGIRILETVEKMPRDLDTLFRSILHMRADNDTKLCLKLFRWLSFYRKQPRLLDVKWILALNTQEAHETLSDLYHSSDFISDPETLKRRVTQICCGLVEFRYLGDSHGSLQFIHQTARDFVIECGLAILQSDGRHIGASAHEQIFHCCAEYIRLSVAEKEKEASDIDSLPMEGPKWQEAYDMLETTVRCIGFHARQAHALGGTEIEIRAFEYLQKTPEVSNRWIRNFKDSYRDESQLAFKSATTVPVVCAMAFFGFTGVLQELSGCHRLDVHERDSRGRNALSYALANEGAARETIDILLQLGVSQMISHTDILTESLHQIHRWACMTASSTIVQYGLSKPRFLHLISRLSPAQANRQAFTETLSLIVCGMCRRFVGHDDLDFCQALLAAGACPNTEPLYYWEQMWCVMIYRKNQYLLDGVLEMAQSELRETLVEMLVHHGATTFATAQRGAKSAPVRAQPGHGTTLAAGSQESNGAAASVDGPAQPDHAAVTLASSHESRKPAQLESGRAQPKSWTAKWLKKTKK